MAEATESTCGLQEDCNIQLVRGLLRTVMNIGQALQCFGHTPLRETVYHFTREGFAFVCVPWQRARELEATLGNIPGCIAIDQGGELGVARIDIWWSPEAYLATVGPKADEKGLLESL